MTTPSEIGGTAWEQELYEHLTRAMAIAYPPTSARVPRTGLLIATPSRRAPVLDGQEW